MSWDASTKSHSKAVIINRLMTQMLTISYKQLSFSELTLHILNGCWLAFAKAPFMTKCVDSENHSLNTPPTLTQSFSAAADADGKSNRANEVRSQLANEAAWLDALRDHFHKKVRFLLQNITHFCKHTHTHAPEEKIIMSTVRVSLLKLKEDDKVMKCPDAELLSYLPSAWRPRTYTGSGVWIRKHSGLSQFPSQARLPIYLVVCDEFIAIFWSTNQCSEDKQA